MGERERAVKLFNYANAHMRDKPSEAYPDPWKYWATVKNHVGYILQGDDEGRYGLDAAIEADATRTMKGPA